MTIDEIIQSRRTIKSFTEQKVDPEEIIELLNIAKWAPNHKITEPWRFLMYTGEGKEHFVQAYLTSQRNKQGEVNEIAERKANHYREIPLHLVVVMPEDPRQRTWDEDYGAVSAMIQNFQLAAWARGIGMVWRTNDYIYQPTFREALGVQPGEKIVATLMIGYPNKIPAAKERTPVEQKLTHFTTAPVQ